MHLTKTERTKKHERREKSGKRRLNNKLKAAKKVRKDAVCVIKQLSMNSTRRFTA